MEILYTGLIILGYVFVVSLLAIHVTKRHKIRRERHKERLMKCDKSDLIDPTVIFQYAETEAEASVSINDWITHKDSTKTKDQKVNLIKESAISTKNKDEESQFLASMSEPETITEETPLNNFESSVNPEEEIISYLLRDRFAIFFDFLQKADEKELLQHLNKLFSFREDERFIMAVSNMLSHESPAVQTEMRRLIEKDENPELLEELVNLSFNQSHDMVGRISSENQVNPAFSHTSIEELLQLIRHEKNGEKLLAYVNELIKFDSSEFDDVIQYATDKLLGNSPEWKTSRQVMVKEKFSNPKDSTFVKNLTLARIGADFSPNHGDYYLNLLRNNYLKNSFSKDSLEATSAKNEYVRGNALLTLVQQQVNAQTYLLLKQHLTDESAFVRRCSVQGISEFAKTSRKHQLITETREIRQMLLSHMIHEKDKQVLHLMEKSLFDLEHNPNQANFTPLCAPTVLDLPFSSSRRLEYHGPVEYHMKQLEKKAS